MTLPLIVLAVLAGGLLLASMRMGRSSKDTQDGLGGWATWQLLLGFKGAVTRGRRRVQDPGVADEDLVNFFGSAQGSRRGSRDLFHQHEDSVVVIGPARSGKTRRFCARAAATAIGPMMATSTKVDLIVATIASRLRRGVVWVYDPLNLLQDATAQGWQGSGDAPPAGSLQGLCRALRWSPLLGCEDPDTALRRATAWAEAQPMDGVQNQSWWTGRAAAVLARLMHAAALEGLDVIAVQRWATNPSDAQPRTILQDKGPAGWAGMLEQLGRSGSNETSGSVVMSVNAILSCLDSPRVVATMTPPAEEHFDIAKFIAAPNTLYLLASEKAGRTVGPVFTMLIAEILFVAGRISQSRPGGMLWPPLRFVGDELPQLAPISDLDKDMSDSGGRGMQVMAVVQDESQLVTRYGREKAATIMGSAALRLYLPGVRSETTQKDLVRLAGQRQVRMASGSTQYGQGRTSSASWNTQREDRLTADKIRELPDGQAWMEYRNAKIGKVNLPEWQPEPLPATVPDAASVSSFAPDGGAR